jgi:hypothetical protein
MHEPRHSRALHLSSGQPGARRELVWLAQQEFRFINSQIKGLNPIEEMQAEGEWVRVRTLEQDERNHDKTGVETDAGTKPVDPTQKLNELSARAARDGSWKPRVFICYSQRDDVLRCELEARLKVLKTEGLVGEVWSDQGLEPGADWDARIKSELERADLIVMLVSTAWLATDYIRNVEMPRALERHRRVMLWRWRSSWRSAAGSLRLLGFGRRSCRTANQCGTIPRDAMGGRRL